MAVSSIGIDKKTLANSVGQIIDRTVGEGVVLGNVWVIDKGKVATCAHLVAAYQSYLSALKVFFPSTGFIYGVESAMFHPKFDMKMATMLAQVALTEPTPTLPLQRYNACVLKLTQELPVLSDDMTWKINKGLSLPMPPREQGLGGNLGEIDLYVVIQTITNAHKEGVLTICDDRNHPVARIFCQGGRLLYAQYENLTNEMAIYQIVSQDLKGNFFFWTASSPNWEVGKPIARPAEMLLIEAHRRFDELKKLVAFVGGPQALHVRTRLEANVDVLPTELQDYCNMIWPLLDGGTPIGQLWQLADIDDCAIYQTVAELLKTKQVENKLEEPEDKRHFETVGGMTALMMANHAQLKPMDRVVNIYCDVVSGKPLVRTGCLLGSLMENDPWHLMHNMRLVPSSAGSPILKDGRVIGMHCGKLPSDEHAQNQQGSMQAMLWVDSIVECLKVGGETALVQKLTLIDAPSGTFKKDKPSLTQAGCREVARIDCPRCGRSSLDAARFCKSCGQRLLKEIEPAPKKTQKAAIDHRPIMNVIACLLLVVAAMGAGAFYFLNMPKPIIYGEEGGEPEVVQPEGGDAPGRSQLQAAKEPAVRVRIFQKIHPKESRDPKHFEWVAQPPGKTYLDGDLIYLEYEALKPGFIYLLYKGSSDSDDKASLIYPAAAVINKKKLAKGERFTTPSEVKEDLDEKKALITGFSISGKPGDDVFVCLVSNNKLDLTEASGKQIAAIYKKSINFIQKNTEGVEAPVKDLIEGTQSGDTIYIKKWAIPHHGR